MIFTKAAVAAGVVGSALVFASPAYAEDETGLPPTPPPSGPAPFQPLKPLITSVTASLPVTQFAGTSIGGGRLANAYYNGYQGFYGFPAVAAAFVGPAIEGAIRDTTNNLQTIVNQAALRAAQGVPVTQVGPYTIGGGRLVNAYINGYVREGQARVFGIPAVQADLEDQAAGWVPPSAASVRASVQAAGR